ncbi:MAG: hypothetical protein Q4F74_02785 [Synergistaceae bacterium]|nr:hypothetical protein [Synergistaceae bacterium]
MIPHIEEIIKSSLEARIMAAIPGLTVSNISPTPGAPSSVITRIESRKPARSVQEGSGVKFYGEVEATVSVTFYNKGQDFIDKTQLLASFMGNPFLQIADGEYVPCEMEESELAEGPHLDVDVWVFKTTYPIYEITGEQSYQTPRLHAINVGDAKELYPEEEPRDAGPEEYFNNANE